MIHYLSTDKSAHWSPHGYGLSHHLHTIVKRLNSAGEQGDIIVTGFQTYGCHISKHWSLKRFLDVCTVSLFLLRYVFPVRV